MDRPGTAIDTVLTDQIFLILTGLILILLTLAVVFAVVVFLLRLRNEREDRLWAKLKGTWEPILLEALSDSRRLSDLWDQVEDKDQLHFLEFALRYAQRLGGAERDVLKQAAAPYLQKVLPLLGHRRVGIRARAVQTLGTLGLPDYLPEVNAAVDDPSPFVAALAARLMARQATPEIAQGFCRKLTRFKTFRSWYLVDMVVEMGPGAVPAIRDTLSDPACPVQIRAVAADSLSVLGDLASADLAGELAEKEDDPTLLTSLMRLLAQVGTGAHAHAARGHLDSEEFFLRAAATRTLSELGNEDHLPLLVEKLGDPSAWVRMAAARGVYRIGGKKALGALSRDEDPARPLFRQVLAEEAGK